MVYEASRRGDGVQPDNIVRSQFGSPAPSSNGNRSGREAASSGDAGEQYRFDPTRPRRRRYAPTDDANVIDAESSEASPGEEPETEGDKTAGQWTVDRPKPDTDATSELPPRPRTTIPRRRRHAAEDEEEYAADRSADLDRIATFLRSTQQAQTSVRRAIDAGDSAAEASGEAARGRHTAPEEKTSELPTVAPPQAALEPKKPSPKPSPSATPEQVLDAVRQIPGVAVARLSDADQKLSLDIADEADADEVHRQVAAVLDSRLGLRAHPVDTVIAEATPRRVPMAPGNRVVLERVQAVLSGFEATIEVALAAGGARAVGRACTPAVDWHVQRGAAEAAVDAVGVLLGNKARVVVEHAAIEQAGPIQVAVVVVLLLTEAGAEQLAGAAPATGDRRQAVVHATLAALNRRLESLMA
ncbi:Putative FHA domain containing protein [Stackebrandtia soli]